MISALLKITFQQYRSLTQNALLHYTRAKVANNELILHVFA